MDGSTKCMDLCRWPSSKDTLNKVLFLFHTLSQIRNKIKWLYRCANPWRVRMIAADWDDDGGSSQGKTRWGMICRSTMTSSWQVSVRVTRCWTWSSKGALPSSCLAGELESVDDREWAPCQIDSMDCLRPSLGEAMESELRGERGDSKRPDPDTDTVADAFLGGWWWRGWSSRGGVQDAREGSACWTVAVESRRGTRSRSWWRSRIVSVWVVAMTVLAASLATKRAAKSSPSPSPNSESAWSRSMAHTFSDRSTSLDQGPGVEPRSHSKHICSYKYPSTLSVLLSAPFFSPAMRSSAMASTLTHSALFAAGIILGAGSAAIIYKSPSSSPPPPPTDYPHPPVQRNQSQPILKYGNPGPVHDFFIRQAYAMAYDRRMRNPAWTAEHLTAQSLKPPNGGDHPDRSHSFVYIIIASLIYSLSLYTHFGGLGLFMKILLYRNSSGPSFRIILGVVMIVVTWSVQITFTINTFNACWLHFIFQKKVPAADAKQSQQAMDQTFMLSNIAPQVGEGFNRDCKSFHWTGFIRNIVLNSCVLLRDYRLGTSWEFY